MKYALSAVLIFSFSVQNIYAQNDLKHFFKQADNFFSTYVIESKIDYQAIQKDNSPLFKLIQQAEIVDLNETDYLTQTCFFINAYNLNTIAGIVKHLPDTEILYHQDLFIKTEITIAGKKLTLNQIQHERLPFISESHLYHFALMQPGFNFPMLANYAYTPENLYEQLEKQTTKVINYGPFLEVRGKKVIVPKLLKWNKKDIAIKKKYILDFINQYRTVAFEHENTKVRFAKLKHFTLQNYVKATQLEEVDIDDYKVRRKKQFKRFNPFALLKPGDTEIQISSNIYNVNEFDYRPFHGNPIVSIGSKFGFSRLINIGLIYNVNKFNNFDPIQSIGPQILFKPIKTMNNVTLETSFLLNGLSSISGNTWNLFSNRNPFCETKLNFSMPSVDKIVLNFTTGIAIADIGKKQKNYRNNTWLFPLSVSFIYDNKKRFSFLGSIEHKIYTTGKVDVEGGRWHGFKGYNTNLQIGLSMKLSPTLNFIIFHNTIAYGSSNLSSSQIWYKSFMDIIQNGKVNFYFTF